MTTITATYSPEDNKLRLYASTRLDAETYERVKAAGFKWAPRQELFVAPSWTPAREDLAIELAGEIEPEEMTLAERAQAKAERLEELASKRHREANAFARRASELSEAFYMGQPILVGHHSERKARKTKERMDAAQAQANKAHQTANYWLYRASGVEHFANMKNDPRTRANRIKTLLAELRDLQRGINNAHAALAIWDNMTTDEKIRWAIGNMDSQRIFATTEMYYAVEKGELSPADARARCIAVAQRAATGPNRKRWIEHTLNRLAFERSMLGEVARYEGELTPVILQAFARENGAEKPVATVTDPGAFELSSPYPLPAHIANGCTLDMVEDDWRDLMQAVGYTVPEAKPRRASSKPAPLPLINPTREDAERLQTIWNDQERTTCKAQGYPERALPNEIKEVTQATYSSNSGGSYSVFETIEISADGRRVNNRGYSASVNPPPLPGVARIRIYAGGSAFHKPRAVVHISDKPAKALPLDLAAIEAATAFELENAGQPATLGGAPYDAEQLRIKRYRPSTTQGEVVLFYAGRKIDRFGDSIRRTDAGTYEGYPDAHWHQVAERVLTAAEERAA
ncbi:MULTISPECIES: DUF3560 domain-containing protein [unclassified Novosphingobium]|uniref:DUF3560 domain-containing protein n=1 Tax=unclassified Novosphingobium TaxID=2644732 RepID=UPI000D327C45|nr:MULTISPECIES: DUF3560 domain-containing protein [unclassified Novosphingobium]PTR08656.1 uncharacterized protein DUF3560 [Novosphingobium sp. GV055]PUB01379.1 uncharacterized protein DUF3560 [Novosphingobium sp. GV061]PUB16953.1 uncharacterized protein DUF3560 [Novosphingobium sp. GV079]PUB39976.1 uncharacterized protein DUF3560 [Novosphingobium sp. GV027]